ncbi:hypothetical protein [Streptomyces sp. NPDC006610]|uniref:hypothetical protein n=1 Tax=Streptomyces sp. NPDC006610 TaxID=3154584 RepID=UPI0033A8E5F2
MSLPQLTRSFLRQRPLHGEAFSLLRAVQRWRETFTAIALKVTGPATRTTTGTEG